MINDCGLSEVFSLVSHETWVDSSSSLSKNKTLTQGFFFVRKYDVVFFIMVWYLYGITLQGNINILGLFRSTSADVQRIFVEAL